jgi:hypothetical protein
VAADLGLVADAAERHAHELAAERAGDGLADRGLAGAGRADQREDCARALIRLDAALLAQLADGDVLDDPVLHVLEAGVVGVEHLAGVLRVEALLRPLAPRHREQPVEVVADHLRLGRSLAHALEPPELALGLLAHRVRHAGLGDLRSVFLDDRALVLAELLAERVELAAQDVLALLLLDAGVDVVADAHSHLHGGEPLALEAERQLQALDDVDGSEQLDLLLEGDLRRVAGRIGQRAGLGDGADERRDAAVVAAQLEDLLDDSAVLALQLTRLDRRRVLVGPFVDLDVETAAGIGARGACDAAMQAGERHRPAAAGQAHAIGDLGDGADGRVLLLVLRHQQDTLLVAHVDGQRHVHVGEDHEVFQWDEQQLAHAINSLSVMCSEGSNYKRCSVIPGNRVFSQAFLVV